MAVGQVLHCPRWEAVCKCLIPKGFGQDFGARYPPFHPVWCALLPCASQAGGANVAAALVRTKPSAVSGCPADVSSIANSSLASGECAANGGSASLVVDMGDVCTRERTTLYLWVAVKAAATVSGRRRASSRVGAIGWWRHRLEVAPQLAWAAQVVQPLGSPHTVSDV